MIRRVRAARLVAAGVLAASAALLVAAAHAGGSKSIQVALPPPQQAKVVAIRVTATAARGKPIGRPKVHTGNDSALGNVSVVYIVKAPHKAAAKETFTIYVAIKRFLTFRSLAADALPPVDVVVEYPSGAKYTLSEGPPANCTQLAQLDATFERGVGEVDAVSAYYTLVAGRSSSEQSSPPEEVLDNVVETAWAAGSCPGHAEGDDPGPK